MPTSLHEFPFRVPKTKRVWAEDENSQLVCVWDLFPPTSVPRCTKRISRSGRLFRNNTCDERRRREEEKNQRLSVYWCNFGVVFFFVFILQRHSMLKQQDLNIAMMVTSREVLSALSQLVPCVGCRRSVERLFSQLVESGNPALEPLTVGPKGVLSVTRSCMTDAKKLYTLFYVHGSVCASCSHRPRSLRVVFLGILSCHSTFSSVTSIITAVSCLNWGKSKPNLCYRQFRLKGVDI